MKEDILEQLVEDWFVSQSGYFVKHNIKYRPDRNHVEYIANKDSVHSDIDILAISNSASGCNRVLAVTCKSWQGGFKPKNWQISLESNADYNERSTEFKPREKWKYFRELVSDKWTDAFLKKIKDETGQRDFIYIIAVAKLIATEEEKKQFEESKIIINRFKEKNSKMKLQILTLKQIINDYFIRINDKSTTSLEATDVWLC